MMQIVWPPAGSEGIQTRQQVLQQDAARKRQHVGRQASGAQRHRVAHCDDEVCAAHSPQFGQIHAGWPGSSERNWDPGTRGHKEFKLNRTGVCCRGWAPLSGPTHIVSVQVRVALNCSRRITDKWLKLDSPQLARVGSIKLLGGQHVVLRGWVLGSSPEPDGLGRPSSLRAVP